MQYQQNQQQGFHVPSQFLPPQQLQHPQQQSYEAQPSAYNPGYVSPQYAGSGTPSSFPAAISPTPTSYVMNNDSSADPALYNALVDTERLIIKQEVEYLEAAVNIAANAVNLDALGAFGEQANKYDIFTDNGGKKFRVIETSNYLCRCCLRPNHELQLHVFLPQDTQNKVMVMGRPWKCGHCCALTDVCQQEMKVYQGDITPNGEPDPSKMIGYIQQPFLGGMFSPKLNVMDREGGQTIATIQAEAKCFIGGMCCNHTFWVNDPQGNYMGKIVKERPGNLAQVAKELATDADNFTMYVPKTMDVKHKANMLAALHLIDYMFFENEGDLNVDVRNQNCRYKCCDFYCCGCILPCNLNCQRCGRKDNKVQDHNGYQEASNGYTTSHGSSHHRPPHHDHAHHHHHGPGRGHHHKHPPHHPPPPPHHDHHHDHHHGHHH